jgi:ADP-ribose pyrophosphatase
MQDSWAVTSREVVYDCRYFKVFRDQLRRPDGGEQDYNWIPSNGAVTILAFDAAGNVVMTRQYRHPVQKSLPDLPGGGINPGESEEDAARRELREETGYAAGRMTRIGAFYPSPARLQTQMTVFVAFDLEPGPTELDDGELVEVTLVPWPKVLELVLTQQPVDSSLAFAVLLWHAIAGKAAVNLPSSD